MDMLKTGWNFFQNEVVGMAWLNRLIGNLINACGLDATSKIGGGIQFFVYDTIKIMVLLGVLILIISYKAISRRNGQRKFLEGFMVSAQI